MLPADGKGAPVKITPEDFHTVAIRFGNAVTRLCDAASRLHSVTTAAAGFAGVDDGAKQFDIGYQQTLDTLFTAFDRAGDVLTDVSLGLDLSAMNHWAADAAATPGGGSPPPWNLVSGLYLPQNLRATSLVGSPVLALPGPLDSKVPLGHQTLLHDVADRFDDAATTVEDLRTGLSNALSELFANNSSTDLDALRTFWNTIGGDSDTAILTAVRSGCHQLSQAVSGFAGWIADTQNRIVDEIISFTGKIAGQTALALLPSVLIDLFTDGLGGLPGVMKAFQDVGKLGELVAVVDGVEVGAAARLAGGVLAAATDANTAMSAAISGTPNPDLDPTTPQDAPGPSDDQEVEQAESVASRADTADRQHYHDLGWDPAVAQFRENEARTAIEIENLRGVRLQRSPEGAGPDWVGSDGKTYDALGPVPSRFFERQWAQLRYRVTQHLAKADYVPIDVSGLSEQQVATVRQYLTDNAGQLDGRVFLVGE
jgi:hypothetical protein